MFCCFYEQVSYFSCTVELFLVENNARQSLSRTHWQSKCVNYEFSTSPAENRLIMINENQLVSTLATLGSMMMIATGLNDLITSYTYIHASRTLSWGCMDISDSNDFINRFKPRSDFIKRISWIWISSGIWGGILVGFDGF